VTIREGLLLYVFSLFLLFWSNQIPGGPFKEKGIQQSFSHSEGAREGTIPV